ncbi:dihydrofolate reductase-like domain-containing protein, partial [Chytridium lagenaria]
GGLPWRIKEDMDYFRKITNYYGRSDAPLAEIPSEAPPNAVIMGRKTWESIPPSKRPLKDRLNIVLSRSGTLSLPENTIGLSSLPEALEYLGHQNISTAFVIGGASVYKEAMELPETKLLFITTVWAPEKVEQECDTFFPDPEQDYRMLPQEDNLKYLGVDAPVGKKAISGIEYRFDLFLRKS